MEKKSTYKNNEKNISEIKNKDGIKIKKNPLIIVNT
jgi:hypothetical protein